MDRAYDVPMSRVFDGKIRIFNRGVNKRSRPAWALFQVRARRTAPAY
jgi:hypothetical protein